MGGSLIINVLVYTHNGGSPITSSIGLKTNILIELTILMVVWKLTLSGFTHLSFHQKTQDMVYIPMGGSPTINIMVCALF